MFPNSTVLVFSGDANGGMLTASDLSGFTALCSINLIDWAALPSSVLSITNGLLMLQDQTHTNCPARFYRILEQ